MKKLTSSLAVAGLAAALAGCSPADKPPPPSSGDTAPGSARPPACTPTTQVNITDVTVASDGNSATIKVAPGDVPVNGPNPGVNWRLPNGYTFETADGVFFPVQTPPQPSGPAASSTTNNGTEFKWCFTSNPSGARWKYSIKFHATGGTPATVWLCDPFIVNADGIMGKSVRPPPVISCGKAP